MKYEEQTKTEMRVREDTIDKDVIKVQIDLELSKNVFEFLNWYCCLANLEPSRFVYSLILHSLSELVYETKWEDKTPFNDIGVR